MHKPSVSPDVLLWFDRVRHRDFEGAFQSGANNAFGEEEIGRE